MKLNQWTLALAAAGVVSLGSVGMAEEAQHQVLTALSSTTLSGYVSTSAIWKFGTGNASMPGRSYDGPGKQDGFNLDVVKLTLEKPLDEGQWAAGYRVDVLAGPDAGTFAGFAATGTPVGLGGAAIEQAYVNLRAPVGNGLDFKMGVFDALMGYESFDSYKNPNFSRSYGYYIEPKQHTGLLASYQLSDYVSIAGGVADTYYGFINQRPSRLGTPGNLADESEKTYLGSIAITAPESLGFLQGATLYAGIVDGLNGAGAITPTDLTGYYVGLTIPTPMEGLAVGASYDYRGNTSQGPIHSIYANAAAFYLSYQATEKLKLNNRFEYATGKGTDNTLPGYPGTWGSGRPGEEEFFAETFTVDYNLWANVISRLEFRWDHDLKGNPGSFGGFGNLPSDGDSNAISLALNIIYKF